MEARGEVERGAACGDGEVSDVFCEGDEVVRGWRGEEGRDGEARWFGDGMRMRMERAEGRLDVELG